ncbi:hypothetical protein RCL32_24900, partial [Salmonella enterica subsp. enterica serovar 1,4,[5],12:i:-]
STDDEILIYPLPVCTARFLTTAGSANAVRFLTTSGSASAVYFLIIGYYVSVVPAVTTRTSAIGGYSFSAGGRDFGV